MNLPNPYLTNSKVIQYKRLEQLYQFIIDTLPGDARVYTLVPALRDLVRWRSKLLLP